MLKDYGKREIRRAEEAVTKRLLMEEYAEWIYNLFPWVWWGTITFRGSPAPKSASALSRIRQHIRHMEEAADTPIAVAVAESYGKDGRLHFHLLIAGVAHLSVDWWSGEAFRRFGTNDLKDYDPWGNACWYFIKNVFARSGEMHLEGDLGRGGDVNPPKSLGQNLRSMP